MRRRPSSWTATLAKLGFRRVKKTKAHVRGRRPRFEPLEVRQLLSGNQSEIDETELVGDPAVAVGDHELAARPQFFAIGGESRNLFLVETIVGADGALSASLSLSDKALNLGEKGLRTSDQLQHEIQLELRAGPLQLARYDVVVTLASDEFLDAYRFDKLAKTQQRT
ncbi:MAG: hypothetical protein AAF961_09855, partial [Planctomycetota bacterium]